MTSRPNFFPKIVNVKGIIPKFHFLKKNKKVRKFVFLRKFRKKSVIFIFGRLVDSVNSFEFN